MQHPAAHSGSAGHRCLCLPLRLFLLFLLAFPPMSPPSSSSPTQPSDRDSFAHRFTRPLTPRRAPRPACSAPGRGGARSDDVLCLHVLLVANSRLLRLLSLAQHVLLALQLRQQRHDDGVASALRLLASAAVLLSAAVISLVLQLIPQLLLPYAHPLFPASLPLCSAADEEKPSFPKQSAGESHSSCSSSSSSCGGPARTGGSSPTDGHDDEMSALFDACGLRLPRCSPSL